MVTRLLRRPVTWALVAALATGTAFGLYWFQPWKLVTSTEVNETLPEVAAVPSTPSAAAPNETPSATPSAKPSNRLVAAGSFISHEHDTSGDVQLIQRPDGGYQVVIRDLDTSNGPDLRVWLTDQPVKEGRAGWHVFDDGRFIELGELKGNKGDQVYDVPSAPDPGEARSITIWCKRFAVSFGAAELQPA